MEKYSRLFQVAAIASLLSAITTAILIYGPDAETTSDFAALALLHDNPLYLYKRWVLFFHPQFAFIASIGIAAALFKKSPVLVSVGLFYLAVWAITEMTQQAYIIDALNQYWRPAYLGSENTSDTAAYYSMLKGFDGISNSMYFVLLFGFGTGSFLFGLAFLSSNIIESCLGITLILIGTLSLAAFFGYYAGPSSITQITDWIYEHLYGVVQTGVRVALGAWLWLSAARFGNQE
jgi:hypothetical protein